MDKFNLFLIVMLYIVVYIKNIEHDKLWYFHKHSNEEEGERFRKYIGKE